MDQLFTSPMWGDQSAGADLDRKKSKAAAKFPAFGLDPDWYETPEQITEDGRQRWAEHQANMKARRQQSAVGGLQSPGNAPMQIPVVGPQDQAAHLAGMIGGVSNAWNDEFDSRVSQAREYQRQQHQREMLRMRLEAEERANNIRALSQQSVGNQFSINPGTTVRIH